ncbi:probable ATP-dependent RNA helicase Dbp73D [Anopheles marshallii]|uniref:probable ATP-dependent RNA helicase Dbp73D n=1 Tax=Anopheles marshallii TaxID=1521116 RepID=UPI00237BE90E|nr:probable ATP-dependent RNA helicase Dbp73D [Anopheles marshallii]
MELFTVNRYDETKLNKEDEKTQEELILQKLQARKAKKALKRTTKTIAEIEETVQQSSEQQENTQLAHPSDAVIEEFSTPNGAPNGLLEEEPESDKRQTEQDANENDEENANQSQADGGGKQLGDFIVLGGDKLHRLKQTDEVLPPWLSHPTIIERDLSSKGPSVKKQTYLNELIRRNLQRMGYKRLFPVQESVIPWILEAHQKPAPFWPRDVCISSPTGSGKTLAFVVPVVQLLLHRVAPAVRALVILPVQELAQQVFLVFQKLCEGTHIRPVCLSRGTQLEGEQKKLVKYCNGEYVSKVDVVVTTAGRLIEHLHSTKGFTLRHLRFLIVDEADKVMNQIQNDWLYHLNKHVKQESDEYLLGRTSELLSQTELFDRARQPHKLLFSATFKRDAEKLKTLKLFHPKLFTAVMDPQERTIMALHTAASQPEPRRGMFAGQYTTPLELQEFVCLTEQRSKPLTLYALIRENGYRKFLVFTNGINNSHRLSFVLQRLFGTEMVIEEWSSSLSPATRKSVLNRFSMGKVNGIICTDALARGIDIESIEVVISYDMPNHVDKYIHRIGRTARAGLRGTAITLLAEDEKKKFNTLLKEANKKELEVMEVNPSLEEEYAAKYANALKELREALALETEVIKKIRNGISISYITRVNLLTKLKDQLDISYSTDIIKSLKYLPKSWTNEAIEMKAMGGKKRKQENPIDDVDSKRPKTTEEVEPVKLVNGKGKPSKKKHKLINGTTNGSVHTTPSSTTIETPKGDSKDTKLNGTPTRKIQKSSSNGTIIKSSPNTDTAKASGSKGVLKRKRLRIKRKLVGDEKIKKTRWRGKASKTSPTKKRTSKANKKKE